ncbi:MAG: trans-4-hydroxy-L-proline dehydratase [Bacteroidota bacterium]
MTERIKRLRNESLRAMNRLSSERAILLTNFYKSVTGENIPLPILRAMAFDHILSHKIITINEGELIVGERGPAPKATPTYPEVSLHSLKDLEVLDQRKKVSFKVDEATREDYRQEIIPYWQGKTNRDRVFERMEPEWVSAYESGVFTEFQEQRSPGHTVLGEKIYSTGLLSFIEEIYASIRKFEQNPTDDSAERINELKGMEIAARALIRFAGRYADTLEIMAGVEKDPVRKAELENMVEVCRHVPAHAPRNLHEALQYYWFVHLGVITEVNPWDSFNPGRLDQHLLPFWRRDLENGTHTKESAVELLQAFWVKFNNHPSPPKMGVTAEESSTYTDFCLINLGGVKPDGSDAVNELTYVLLDVIEEMRLLQPSSMVQVSRKNPDAFIDRTLKIVKTGFGQPSIFNTDTIVKELTRQGKAAEDARRGGASGCVESGAFGTEAYILTGYFNLVKVLEITLHNGIDPMKGKQVGLQTGDPRSFASFEELFEAYRKQLRYFLDIKIEGNDRIEQIFAEHLPVPFLSLFIDDCIASGMDYHNGGARYNTKYVQGVGLGSVTDMLTAIRYHVYDHKTLGMDDMIGAIDRNFEGDDELRATLVYDTPKYGNDDDYADDQAVRVFESFFSMVDDRKSPRGTTYRINMLPTTSHIYFGKVTGAMPDGRLAKEPLSEGISPFQGADRKGPTAVLNSAARIDHVRTGGTLLNQKFTPAFFEGEDGIPTLRNLIRGYFSKDTHHIQFNVVTAATLREAQKHPEKYQDLIVRVAGYSDYFKDLGPELQDEIIRRTEHESC